MSSSLYCYCYCCYCYCYWGLIVQGSDYHPVGTERIVKNPDYPRTSSASEIPIIQGLRYLKFESALFGAFSSIRPVQPYRYFTANYYMIPIAYIPSRERNKVQYNIWDNCCLLKVHLLDSTKDWYSTIHRKLVTLINKSIRNSRSSNRSNNLGGQSVKTVYLMYHIKGPPSTLWLAVLVKNS